MNKQSYSSFFLLSTALWVLLLGYIIAFPGVTARFVIVKRTGVEHFDLEHAEGVEQVVFRQDDSEQNKVEENAVEQSGVEQAGQVDEEQDVEEHNDLEQDIVEQIDDRRVETGPNVVEQKGVKNGDMEQDGIGQADVEQIDERRVDLEQDAVEQKGIKNGDVERNGIGQADVEQIAERRVNLEQDAVEQKEVKNGDVERNGIGQADVEQIHEGRVDLEQDAVEQKGVKNVDVEQDAIGQADVEQIDERRVDMEQDAVEQKGVKNVEVENVKKGRTCALTNYKQYVAKGRNCTVYCVDGEEHISCLKRECIPIPLSTNAQGVTRKTNCHKDHLREISILNETCTPDDYDSGQYADCYWGCVLGFVFSICTPKYCDPRTYDADNGQKCTVTCDEKFENITCEYRECRLKNFQLSPHFHTSYNSYSCVMYCYGGERHYVCPGLLQKYTDTLNNIYGV